ALQNRRSHTPHRPLHPLPPGQRLAVSDLVLLRHARRQQQLTRFFASYLIFPLAVRAELCSKSLSLGSRRRTALTNRMTWPTPPLHQPPAAPPRKVISALG